MKRSVRFRPEAETEALESQRWYETRRRGLGSEFAQAVLDAVSRIAEHPTAFPRVRGDTRRAVLRRFPYAVYFRTLDDHVIVLAVHGRQHQGRWQSR